MISNKEQFGFKGLDLKGVCIHNTGNRLSAKENYEIMRTTKLALGTHFFIDEDEIIQAMPLDWCVYQTGKGIDWACRHCVSIEICRSQCDLETYIKAQDRAFLFIKEKFKGLPIYYHIDFNPKFYCPHRILDLYRRRKEDLCSKY